MPGAVGWAASARASLSDRVREEIERMILSGEYPSGARINESEVAQRLRTSRAPVREALQALVSHGVVRSVRNRGMFVREVSLEEALDLYDIRAGLACTTGRLLAARAGRAQLGRMEALWEAMDAASRDEDSDRYHVLNLGFHEYLLTSTGNARLIELLGIVQKELALFMRRGVLGPQRLSVSNAEHRDIIDAIKSGDVEQAGLAYMRHIQQGKQRMLDSLASQRRMS